MGVKLIALDLDGTTLNRKSEFSDNTIKAFQKARNQDIHVVIATGRCFFALPPDVEKVYGLIEYATTSNGAEIRTLTDGKCIYKNCIDAEATEKLYEIIKENNLMIESFVDGKAYMTKKEYEDTINGKFSFRSIDYVRRTRNTVDNAVDFMLENKGNIENVNFFFHNDDDKEYVRKVLQNVKNTTLTSSQICNLEIGGATTSKATAIHELARSLNITKEEIMAVGDSPNDIDLLKISGISVAVENAQESVKEVANFITDTNDNDGVAKAILKYI